MLTRFSIVAVSLLFAAAPVLAQSSQSAAERNAVNWDVFLKLYPPRALAAHEEGAVGFVVTLNSKGDVTRCQVTHSSGHPLLDEETCKIVTMNAVFNPDPGLSQSQERTHEGLIAWKLPASPTVLAPPQPVTTAAAPEKTVCKKTVRVGTLAGFERTCMTPREWARQSDEERRQWEETRQKGGSDPGCLYGSTCDSTAYRASTQNDAPSPR